MDLLQILALGITQAVTEWLPLSSKTMDTLLYLGIFNGDKAGVVSVLLFLHFGTLCAATIYFRKELAELALELLAAPKNYIRARESKVGFIISALFFTGIVAIPLLLIEKLFLPNLEMGVILTIMGAGLIATGFLLTTQKKQRWRIAETATWKDGMLTGALQGLSVIPGVSRAGCSTTGLIWRGFDSESAFRLSFLLSIPTVFVAEVLLWLFQLFQGDAFVLPIFDGFALALASFAFGYLTIDILIKFAHRVNVAWLAFLFGIMMLLFGIIGLG